MKKKIFVQGPVDYANWLPYEIAPTLEEADILMLTGGEDVSPQLYGEAPHPQTYNWYVRDEIDAELFFTAKKRNMPILGICRGSQLTTVLNGGKLIQHVNHHGIGGTHKMTDKFGNVLDITSTHHQMHYPYNLHDEQYELVAWSTEQRSDVYEGANGEPMKLPENFKESEIVYFPMTNSMGIQGHPEHLEYDHPTCQYLRELVDKYLFK